MKRTLVVLIFLLGCVTAAVAEEFDDWINSSNIELVHTYWLYMAVMNPDNEQYQAQRRASGRRVAQDACAKAGDHLVRNDIVWWNYCIHEAGYTAPAPYGRAD